MQLALWQDQDVVRKAPGRLPKAPGAKSPPSVAASPLERLEAQANRYVEQAHADNTRRAYQSDWAAFVAWCAASERPSLPTSESTLELYLTHLAGRGLRPSTIRRARIAVELAHGHAGLPRPDQTPRLRALERGISRSHSTRERGAEPLLERDLAACVRVLGRTERDDRDCAILLLGFSGALRCSELVGLNIEQVRFDVEGATVFVERSKEDQLARGATTRIPLGRNAATCPVRALRVWIERVGCPTEPLFRAIYGHVIDHERMSTRCVSRAVQRAAAKTGLDVHYSAHSLRVGLATSAYAHGATEREIQLHGSLAGPALRAALTLRADGEGAGKEKRCRRSALASRELRLAPVRGRRILNSVPASSAEVTAGSPLRPHNLAHDVEPTSEPIAPLGATTKSRKQGR